MNDDIDKAIQAIEERATMRFDDLQHVLTLLREFRDLRERVRWLKNWAEPKSVEAVYTPYGEGYRAACRVVSGNLHTPAPAGKE